MIVPHLPVLLEAHAYITITIKDADWRISVQRTEVLMAEEEKLEDFDVNFVTFYDGSGHNLGPSECTLTSKRLIISDAKGGMHQIWLSDISGIATPSRMFAKKLRISLPGQAYDVDFQSKEQKKAIEYRLGRAIRGSFG